MSAYDDYAQMMADPLRLVDAGAKPEKPGCLSVPFKKTAGAPVPKN
jgi:hypothetical protein